MKTPAPLLEELEEQLCAELEDLCPGGHDPEDPLGPGLGGRAPGLRPVCRTGPSAPLSGEERPAPRPGMFDLAPDR